MYLRLNILCKYSDHIKNGMNYKIMFFLFNGISEHILVIIMHDFIGYSAERCETITFR